MGRNADARAESEAEFDAEKAEAERKNAKEVADFHQQTNASYVSYLGSKGGGGGGGGGEDDRQKAAHAHIDPPDRDHQRQSQDMRNARDHVENVHR